MATSTDAPAAPAAPAAALGPFKLGVPIPALLWTTFEEALRINIRRLAKDISTTLGKPDAPLLDALLKPSTGAPVCRPYLFEEATPSDATEELEVDMRCEHLCQRPDAPALLQPCRQPVVWSAAATHRCAEHLYCPPPPVAAFATLPTLTPIEPVEDEVTTLFSSPEGNVYDGAYALRGKYDKTSGTLTLFEVVCGDGESTSLS